MLPLDLSSIEIDTEIDRISKFINSQAGPPNHKVLLGLSGGIDSDLAARLCVRAVGPERMKCFVVLQEDFENKYLMNARCLSQDINVELVEIPFGPFPKQLISLMAEADPKEGFVLDPPSLDIRRGKCALRTFIFSAYAEHSDYIIIGPSNRTELEIGLFMPFADGLAHCQPIVHLYKTQVFKLAEKLGTRIDVIKQPPAAGFWPGDEDLRGIAYWLFNGEPVQVEPKYSKEDKNKILQLFSELNFRRLDQALIGFNEDWDIDRIADESGLSQTTTLLLQKLRTTAYIYKRRVFGANLL